MNFHELEIENVKSNTKNAVLVEFCVPSIFKENYVFEPGQHVALDFKIERNNYRRTYSICSAPHENKLCISVKRQHKGIISNYINDGFFKGFKVKVSEPFGNFYDDQQIEYSNKVVLWAAGSGITPMISIAKHILKHFSNKKIHLFYANTNDESIMFENEIAELEYSSLNNFTVTQILSNTKNEAGLLSKILNFKSNKKPWNGLTGYITNELIHEKLIDFPKATHYICGPEKMMEICETALNHNSETVYIEHFTGSSSIKNSNKEANLKVSFFKTEHQIKLGDKNLLEAMLDNNLNPPYACKSGTCGSCKAILISGEVVMARDFALNEADREAGKILCCQTWAKSDEIVIGY
jgi:ring-1,2-phenylacetyl-CoA epoxidase subunit PaaE